MRTVPRSVASGRGGVRTALAAAALAVLVLLAFGRVYSHGWLEYDDRFHVLENPHVMGGSASGLRYLWTHQFGNLYVPVSYTVFWAQAAATQSLGLPAGGEALSPLLFQTTKPVLHAICAALALLVLRRLGFGLVASTIGAGLFALHPLQAEVVGWISETRGLLATVSSLAALVGVLSVRGEWSRLRGVVWYAAATAALGVALLAKPSAATLPLAAWVLLVFQSRGRVVGGAWRAALAMMPWAAMGGAVVLLTRSLQPGEGVPDAAPLWARPLIAGDALAFYLGRLVWPAGLSPDYGRTPAAVLAGGWVYAAWLVPAVLVAGCAAWAWRGRRDPAGAGTGVLAGLGVMVAMLVPVLGLVTFDHQAISTVADRYMALALLGPGVAAAALLDRRGWGLLLACALAVGVLGIASFRQVGVWRDDQSLWSHAVAARPDAPTARNNLGFALAKLGRHEEAATQYREALRLRPGLSLATLNLAWSLGELRRFEAAEPLYIESLRLRPSDPRAHLGYGLLLARSGRTESARLSLARAVELGPDNPEAQANYGVCLAQLGRVDESAQRYSLALLLRPRYGVALFNLGLLLRERPGLGGLPLGIQTEADALKLAVEADPGLGPAWFHLGDALATASEFDEAAGSYERALALMPQHADAANNLGLVRVRQRRFAEAAAAFERALAAEPGHGEARENLAAARKMLGQDPP